jgi:hypothetical protein
MKPVLMRHAGLTLLELLIGGSIGSGLMLVILQLFMHSNLIALEQQQLSRQLQNAESVRHLLSHSVRDAMYSRVSVTIPSDSRMNCPGISLDNVCLPPLQIWEQGATGPISATAAVPGSHLLWIKQSCCPGVIADLFFLWYRAGDMSNAPSLFRRRQLSDGRFSASEELVEGVSHLLPILTRAITDESSGALMYQTGLSPLLVSDWWSIVAIEFELTLASSASAAASDKTIAFSVVSRQWSQ